MLAALPALGPVTVQARRTLISLSTPRRVFAVVQPTTRSRVDLGLRLGNTATFISPCAAVLNHAGLRYGWRVDDDPAALGDKARDLLTVKGALAFGELATELDAWPTGLRKALDAHPQLFESPDGEWASGLRLADEVVLTHELSEFEASSGMLSSDDDLALWAVFASAPGGLPLAAGGTAGTTTFLDLPPATGEGADLTPGQGLIAQYITGPDGWLAGFCAGDLLAARLRGGALELSASRPVPPGPGAVRLAEACAAAVAQELERYGRGAAAAPFGALHEVIISLLFTERHLFASPQPPLGRSLHTAGLETFAGSVGVRGTSWNLSRLSRLSHAEAVAGTKATGLLLDPAILMDHNAARQALEYLTSSPAVTDFVANEVERRTAQGTDLGDQLARIADVARSPRDRSVACFLKARWTEGRADSVPAETLVSQALAGQLRLPGALTDAAEYAACRGDVRAADGYLRQVDHPTSDAFRSALRRLLVPPTTAAGRNQPCSCGSGRKYKMCCLGKEVHPITERAEALYALLATHAQRAAYAETLGVLIARSGATSRAALFCVDLLLTNCGAAERFLRSRGGWLRDDERELIESWVRIPIGAFEVRDVQRGTGVTVRMLPGGEPSFLKDRKFSSSVRRLDLFVGRILRDGAQPRLLAVPVPVDRGERVELLDLLERGPSAQELAEFVAPRPEPYAQNADGHDYYDAEAVWQMPDEAAGALGWARLAERMTATSDDSMELLADKDGGQACRGQVRRDGRRWTLLANSRERRAELAEIVRQAAPDACEISTHAHRIGGEPHRRAKTVMLESFLVTPGAEPAREGSPGHTRAWVNMVVDSLGMTPREAVRAGGRARDGLEMLVDDLEWRESRQAEAGEPPLMDIAWVRRELGLITGPSP